MTGTDLSTRQEVIQFGEVSEVRALASLGAIGERHGPSSQKPEARSQPHPRGQARQHPPRRNAPEGISRSRRSGRRPRARSNRRPRGLVTETGSSRPPGRRAFSFFPVK